MLRVGLTGDLGSGKSTVARLLSQRGAVVLCSDEMARAMMEPGEPVYRAIREWFGAQVVDASGRLDRAELARLAFDPAQPRVDELNALIHPAVLYAQEERIRVIAQEHPDAIVVVESALIFSVKAPPREGADAHASTHERTVPWRSRFDCVVVVTAPRAVKIERFVNRALPAAGLPPGAGFADARARIEADARRRLDTQAATLVPEDDSVLTLNNASGLDDLAVRVEALWKELRRRAGSGEGSV